SIATTLDLSPTIIDFADAKEPEGVQGQSMRGLLTGQSGAFRHSALTENDDDFVPMKMRVLTTSQWKLVYYVGQNHGELYDREHDPQEMINLWNQDSYSAIKQQLLHRLLEEVIISQDMRNGRIQPPNPQPPKWGSMR
ncbi:MAG: DUF4976 domain-containing protein, partial [Anaerolineae bacterium]|nr:DUF4976 domain-containing protein [Anaerolineae bacterium]